jgi:hypothetical protein
MSPLAGLKNLPWVLLLPRLRRGLNDCARFAGFQATTDFGLTLTRLAPWATLCLRYRGLRRAESPKLAPMGLCPPDAHRGLRHTILSRSISRGSSSQGERFQQHILDQK